MRHFKFMRRTILVLLFCCYSYIVLYLTLFGRQVYPGDPLGIVFGGWDFRRPEDGGDVHAFYNLFMLTPTVFLLLSILPNKARKFWKSIRWAAVFSFVVSLSIEVSQVVFCVGTLQISDLIYNTISGVFGAIVYYMVTDFFV